MITKKLPSKVWVVYGYHATQAVWDVIAYSIHYRNLKWIFRNNASARALHTNGYTKFVLKRSRSVPFFISRWCKVSDNVYRLLKRISKNED